MKAGNSQNGLTLVELLAAMAIFLGLAGMVLQVLSGGLNLWATGEKNRATTDQGAALLDRLSVELRHLLAIDRGGGLPKIRLHSDFIRRDDNHDGLHEFRSQRLLFVRRAYEERTDPLLFYAGRESGSARHYLGASIHDDEEPPVLRPTGGMAEIVWLPLPDVRAGFEGRIVLWRAYRSPVGGPRSLFESVDEVDGGLRQVPMEVVAENLLYLGFEFLDAEYEDDNAPAGQGGPSWIWDSTRGVIPAGSSEEAFAFARGSASLENADDDIFPLAIRITVVVAPPPGEALEARLSEDLPADLRSVPVQVEGGRFLRKLGPGNHYLRIHQEWLEISETDGRTLLLLRRGQRGTTAVDHPAGSKVLVGRQFQRTVRLDMTRADLNTHEEVGQ